ncbi:MAG: cytidylyltransferase domain-containing protein [Spirochaetia bacterium]
MTGIYLQVRLGSKRLPEKALLDLSGKNVIEHAMDSLRRVPADVYALVTDENSYQALTEIAQPYGFSVFAGSSEDVLKRYLDAARYYGTDVLIRATGDNPLVSWEMAIRIREIFDQKGSDFSSFKGMPLGTGVEVFKLEALEKAFAETSPGYYREHVSPYMYDNPDKFFIYRPDAEEQYVFPEGRVTLDTVDDYLYISKIYEELYRAEPISLISLVEWLKKEQENITVRHSA